MLYTGRNTKTGRESSSWRWQLPDVGTEVAIAGCWHGSGDRWMLARKWRSLDVGTDAWPSLPGPACYVAITQDSLFPKCELFCLSLYRFGLVKRKNFSVVSQNDKNIRQEYFTRDTIFWCRKKYYFSNKNLTCSFHRNRRQSGIVGSKLSSVGNRIDSGMGWLFMVFVNPAFEMTHWWFLIG